MARWPGIVLGLGLNAALAACSSPPPPPPPTEVALTMTAAADANPTPAGQGAPVVVRIYQLASGTAFGNAEFFDLFNQDQATLKGDLIKRDDVTLVPGQTKTMTLMPTDQVKTIGIFAGYRDYQNAKWRGSADVVAHKTTKVTVLAGSAGITVTPPAGSPPPAAPPAPPATPAAATPAAPTMPAMPTMPATPAMPTMPTMPTLPAKPVLPGS